MQHSSTKVVLYFSAIKQQIYTKKTHKSEMSLNVRNHENF